jgi:hypothetical protein
MLEYWERRTGDNGIMKEWNDGVLGETEKK